MHWPDDDRFWTAKDVARYLQASESWVRHAAAAGRLKVYFLVILLADVADI